MKYRPPQAAEKLLIGAIATSGRRRRRRSAGMAPSQGGGEAVEPWLRCRCGWPSSSVGPHPLGHCRGEQALAGGLAGMLAGVSEPVVAEVAEPNNLEQRLAAAARAGQ